MYKRYYGNSGRVDHVEERQPERRPPEPPRPPPAPRPRPGVLGPLQERLRELEREDLLLMLILYLMYRESGDSELLLMMGAMFLT